LVIVRQLGRSSCVQKFLIEFADAFASGKFRTNPQKSVFGKSVDYLNRWVAIDDSR
jgi:hypothetical protein